MIESYFSISFYSRHSKASFSYKYEILSEFTKLISTCRNSQLAFKIITTLGTASRLALFSLAQPAAYKRPIIIKKSQPKTQLATAQSATYNPLTSDDLRSPFNLVYLIFVSWRHYHENIKYRAVITPTANAEIKKQNLRNWKTMQ